MNTFLSTNQRWLIFRFKPLGLSLGADQKDGSLWFLPYTHARAKEINQVKADYDITKLTYKNHRLIFLAVGLFYLRV